MSTAQESAASHHVLDGVAMIGFVITGIRGGERIDASSCWISYQDGRYGKGLLDPDVLEFQGQFLASARAWLDRATPYATVAVGCRRYIARRDGVEAVTVTLEPIDRPRHTFDSLHHVVSSIRTVLGSEELVSNGGLILVGDAVGGAGRAVFEAMLTEMTSSGGVDLTLVRDRPGPVIAGIRGADDEAAVLPISTAVRRAIVSPASRPPVIFVESELTPDLAGRIIAATSAGIGVVSLCPGRDVEQVISYFGGMLCAAGQNGADIIADHLRVAAAPAWRQRGDKTTVHCPILLSKNRDSIYARSVRRGYWGDARKAISMSVEVITDGKGVSTVEAMNVDALIRIYEKRLATTYAGICRGY